MAITRLTNAELGLEPFVRNRDKVPGDADIVRQLQLNTVNEKLDELVVISHDIADVTLTAVQIVGTAAGDVNHADGAILVAAAGLGLTYQFLGAVLIYDFDTAAYTGAGNDTVINIGVTGTQVAHTTAIAAAQLWTAAADSMLQVNPLGASDQLLYDNAVISLFAGTAPTQPGTAAGTLRCLVSYRTLTTGL